MKYLPFMRSVSVVPAGLSKYREGLYPLELFDKEEAEEVIDLIESYQKKAYDEFGLHFIHAVTSGTSCRAGFPRRRTL